MLPLLSPVPRVAVATPLARIDPAGGTAGVTRPAPPAPPADPPPVKGLGIPPLDMRQVGDLDRIDLTPPAPPPGAYAPAPAPAPPRQLDLRA
jgi:hypothetical protein